MNLVIQSRAHAHAHYLHRVVSFGDVIFAQGHLVGVAAGVIVLNAGSQLQLAAQLLFLKADTEARADFAHAISVSIFFQPVHHLLKFHSGEHGITFHDVIEVHLAIHFSLLNPDIGKATGFHEVDHVLIRALGGVLVAGLEADLVEHGLLRQLRVSLHGHGDAVDFLCGQAAGTQQQRGKQAVNLVAHRVHPLGWRFQSACNVSGRPAAHRPPVRFVAWRCTGSPGAPPIHRRVPLRPR